MIDNSKSFCNSYSAFFLLYLLLKLSLSFSYFVLYFQDLRQLPARLAPTSSAAVRALSSFGNGLSNESRPSTPTTINVSSAGMPSGVSGTADSNSNSTNSHAILSQKINKLFAERQTSQLGYSQTSIPSDFELSNDNLRGIRDLDGYLSQNGSNDFWQEDQEVRI